VEDLSTLASELNGLTTEGRKRPGPLCQVGRCLEVLNDADRAALQAILDDASVPSHRISSVLVRNGHSVGLHAVIRHRRGYEGGGCACSIR
jgi:hypothetical protein